jgi:hypothetical protein
MTIDQALQRAASSDFSEYDPGATIAAVNELVAIGHDGALAALERFVQAADLEADPHRGLFLVMRVAFEADPHPPLRLGGAALTAPPAPAFPRFPIAIIEDVPLMLIGGYTLGGLAEPVTAHVEYYRRHGKLRSAPLAPRRDLDVRAAFDGAFLAAYGTPPGETERDLIGGQVARLPR